MPRKKSAALAGAQSCPVPQRHARTSPPAPASNHLKVVRLFLLLRLGTLDLCGSAQGLLSVLALLACISKCLVSQPHAKGKKERKPDIERTLLSAGTLGLGGESDTDQAVLGLELLQSLGGVVDEGEAGGLAATEVGAQAEDLDLLLLGLVQAAELLAQLSLGDVGTAGVEDVTIHG